ncbi:putative dual specificity protein phosphatase [Gregarina niphandrodes]|uniref:protein-tyrosine-phosphatase n=1 Tax=Gregarina niphandrodes TaxID=110365 RepID=A0A023B781_GRENI|nr:putative dual specificity protein phosphatase [Gregarina niphandrodes]EZG67084.1 putative dual specificity protein phosphatase [Gregarina niphandrodes]|eukprot:XP_011130338.1 putative dual specificity protein phosphatase [Gregarina niphandrodes]
MAEPHEATQKQKSRGYVNKSDKQRVLSTCENINLNEAAFQKLSKTIESEMAGVINCPYCNFKLGRYAWTGSNCTCGAFVTPSFFVPKSKVDKEVPIPSNTFSHPT